MLPLYMKRALLATGLMNLFGSVSFLPFVTSIRRSTGLPEAHPFFLWLLALWIAGFGAVYLSLGISGRIDRSFLTIGAFGKLSFALLLIAFWLSGDFPLSAPFFGLADLFFGALFAFYLWTTHRPQKSL